MNWYTSADGDQRIYYTEEEIEQIFDHELARAGRRPTPAAPVTALEPRGRQRRVGAGTGRRWRATLAHEAAHIVLHRYLSSRT